ncbi:transcriptional regulator [Streptomyces sp. NPDC048718]|uniref:transcriptional regulator n=1 Tax=Streptomyces sp. NPDC048718 TaxID=3365587 RepID=UPI0037123CAD
MYDISTRRRALALVDQGRSLNSVSKQTGISRAALRSWQIHLEPRPRMSAHRAPCVRCRPTPGLPEAVEAYAYLLGLYLGDGCVSPHRQGSQHLRIACADAWPGLIEACRDAMRAVQPYGSVCLVRKQGCVAVTSYGRHWTCLFPQHGPGKKHDRRIVLEDWQQGIVDAHPWEFIRGLIHSDGARIVNWASCLVGGERKRYEYPRYFFSNVSDDIVRLFTDTLDRLGVAWRSRRRKNGVQDVSVARREAVALMDTHIGPKY